LTELKYPLPGCGGNGAFTPWRPDKPAIEQGNGGAQERWQEPTSVSRFIHMNWIFWAALSAIFAGVTAILAKVGVKGIDSNLATAIRTSVVLVFAWSVAFLGQTQKIADVTQKTWLFLVLSGFATGASWLCYFKALQLGDASKVAPVDKLSVVVAIILAAIFLHEPLNWHHWMGGALIVSGAVVVAWG
jgi:transporter family protein